LRHPEHAGLIQRVLAIPTKRHDRAVVSFLTQAEMEAVLASPNGSLYLGRRDHALLVVALQTGLRVSELVGLRCQDVELGPGAHLRCHGKGRKERCTPLTKNTVATLRAWLQERSGDPADPLFPGPRGGALSRDAVRRLVTRHVRAAAATCPSLAAKQVSPHVLRHSCAMQLLHADVDTSVIALWLVRQREFVIHSWLWMPGLILVAG
jgi:integrase/recombinase XerD